MLANAIFEDKLTAELKLKARFELLDTHAAAKTGLDKMKADLAVQKKVLADWLEVCRTYYSRWVISKGMKKKLKRACQVEKSKLCHQIHSANEGEEDYDRMTPVIGAQQAVLFCLKGLRTSQSEECAAVRAKMFDSHAIIVEKMAELDGLVNSISTQRRSLLALSKGKLQVKSFLL